MSKKEELMRSNVLSIVDLPFTYLVCFKYLQGVNDLNKELDLMIYITHYTYQIKNIIHLPFIIMFNYNLHLIFSFPC